MLAACLLASPLARAERPMAVEDAGTLDRGGVNFEFGWSRDDHERGVDGVVGYGPIENVEVEFGLAYARDRDLDPDSRARGAGIAVKWVPIQAETGLSAGVYLAYERVRTDPGAGSPDETERVRTFTGLLRWGFATGQALSVNLGREWSRIDGDTQNDDTWGLGFEQPLGGPVTLTLEIFGVEDSRPDRQIGLRYELAEGLNLSAAVGRGSDRTIANAGIAWEF